MYYMEILTHFFVSKYIEMDFISPVSMVYIKPLKAFLGICD